MKFSVLYYHLQFNNNNYYYDDEKYCISSNARNKTEAAELSYLSPSLFAATPESEGQLVCVVVRQTSDNTSGVIRQEVQELKDLSYVIKQQQKIKKKVV